VLSRRTILDFIERSKKHRSARRYLEGLSTYLYGVVARERSSESDLVGRPGDAGYAGKYDRAVSMLGDFDRPPAEAICGMVAFHYNQFVRAMAKTKSQRVANVSLRIQAMISGSTWDRSDLSSLEHSSLDHALSDSMIDQVLKWGAIPLDGSANLFAREIDAELKSHRPEDQFKLRFVAVEHYLAAGDPEAASCHAEALRHSRDTESWYTDFRGRLEGACSK
jgi:hypothetical protein